LEEVFTTPSVLLGRAKRGGSGSLSPEIRSSGAEFFFRGRTVRWWPTRPVLKAGSCAAGTCEPRQVRKEAAVSRLSRVPQGCLAGAGLRKVPPGSGRSRRSARPSVFAVLLRDRRYFRI